MRLEERVTRLEAAQRPEEANLRVVIAKAGETAEQARQREGVREDEHVITVIFEAPRSLIEQDGSRR
jgi:hypothetical protein